MPSIKNLSTGLDVLVLLVAIASGISGNAPLAIAGIGVYLLSGVIDKITLGIKSK